MTLRSAPLRALLAALLALMIFAVPARADGIAVIQDCIQGADGISGTYTQRDYREALEMLTGDSDEYSDCRDQIREAQYAAARGAGRGGSGGGSGGGPASGSGGGGGSSVSPSAFGAALRADGVDPGAAPGTGASDPGPLEVGGERIRLGEAGVPSVDAALSLPLPLLAAAIATLLAALIPAGRLVLTRLRRRGEAEPTV